MKFIFSRTFRSLFNSPFADRLQSRPRRRAVSAAVVLWQPVIVTCMLLVREDEIWPLFAAAGVQLGLLLLLAMTSRGMYDLDDMHLDERQASQRDADYRKAYYIGLFWLLTVTPFHALVGHLEAARHYLLAYTMPGFLWGAIAPQVLYGWSGPVESLEGE